MSENHDMTPEIIDSFFGTFNRLQIPESGRQYSPMETHNLISYDFDRLRKLIMYGKEVVYQQEHERRELNELEICAVVQLWLDPTYCSIPMEPLLIRKERINATIDKLYESIDDERKQELASKYGYTPMDIEPDSSGGAT